MEFEYPYILFLIPFFLFLFWHISYRKNWVRKYMSHPGGNTERLNGMKLFMARLPNIFLSLAVVAGIIVLAWPLGETVRKEKKEKVHNIKLAMDVSGSMTGRSLRDVTKIAKEFIKSRKGDLIGIVPFDSTVIESLVISSTTDTEYLEYALDTISFYDGLSTGIGNALLRAIIDLINDILPEDQSINPIALRLSLESRNWGKYARDLIDLTSQGMENAVCIIFTDSGNNTGIDPIEVLRFAEQMKIKVYVIRIDVRGSDRVFRRAIRKTGGIPYNARSFASVASFLQEIDQIEKREEIVEIKTYKKPLYDRPLKLSVLLFILMVIIEFVYRKNP